MPSPEYSKQQREFWIPAAAGLAVFILIQLAALLFPPRAGRPLVEFVFMAGLSPAAVAAAQTHNKLKLGHFNWTWQGAAIALGWVCLWAVVMMFKLWS